MVPTTRQKILAYLQEHRKASAPELGRALMMTRANMRYHLDRLLEESLIEEDSSPASHPSRGRPIIHYRLSVTARPNNLPQLSGLLLNTLLANLEEHPKMQVLHNLADHIADNPDLPRHLTQRLNRAIQMLNSKRYNARWEARPQGPQIVLRNCPYAAILPDHPELCQMDVFLLGNLLAEPVQQIAKMDLLDNHPPACLFILAQKVS